MGSDNVKSTNIFKRFISRVGDVQKSMMLSLFGKPVASNKDYVHPGNIIPVTEFVNVEKNSTMSTAKYNDTMTSLLVDIEALYVNTDIMSDTIANNESLSKTWTSDVRGEISNIKRKLEEYKRLYSDEDGYNAVYYEVFDSGFNNRTHALLNSCVVSNGLRITPWSVSEYSKASDIDRVTMTSYPSENYAAGIFIASPAEFNIETDYNTSSGTRSMIRKGTSYPGAWISVLLSDNSVRSFIDGSEYSGYTCMLRIFFNAVKTINRITVSPATRYPLYVSRLMYRAAGAYASDDDGWLTVTKTISTKDVYDGDTVKVTGEGSTSIDMTFDSVPASAIEILFTMPSYDIIRYNIDQTIKRSAMLWDGITDAEYSDISSKWEQTDLVSSEKPAGTDTKYMDRTIIDIANLESVNNMVKAVNTSLNINKDTELQSAGVPGLYYLKDPADEVALRGQLDTVNKHEYVVGAYSIVPYCTLYSGTATYISHIDGGFDSYVGTVNSISIESEFETPGITSVEYFIVTDNGTEVPILPVGVTHHREPMDGEIDASGEVAFTMSFTPSGDAYLYRWDGSAKVLVATETPDGNSVEFTGLDSKTKYVVEYDVEPGNNTNTVLMNETVTTPIWIDNTVDNSMIINNKVRLQQYPFIDYSYYDWDSAAEANDTGIRSDVWSLYNKVAGYYSDDSVLIQDLTSQMWVVPDEWISGEFVPGSTDRDNFAISGFFTASGTYIFYYNGKDTVSNQTGSEDYEYSYAWSVPVSGGAYPLASTVLLNNDNILEAGAASGYNENRYEPIELFIDGVKATDITNYKANEQSTMNQFMAQNYEYFMLDGVLYTNANLDGKRITVRYKYLSEYIRVKIILSVNESNVSEHTPIVYNYTLKMLGL